MEQKTINKKCVCPFCGGKMHLNKAFCSTHCKETYFEDMKIILSPRFIKHAHKRFYTKSELEEHLIQFASYHKFDHGITIEKFYREAKNRYNLLFTWRK